MKTFTGPASPIAICILCFYITPSFVLSDDEGTCGGPLENLSNEVGFIPAGRQVVLAAPLHEFNDCGQISQWSMIFECIASSDGNGYPLELQVFSQMATRRFILRSTAPVTLQDEQCEGQPVTFDVSLPFCQGDHVGMHIPNLTGLDGLGFRETGNMPDSYLHKELLIPPAMGDEVSFVKNDTENFALPLVSVEVTNCGVDSTAPPHETAQSSSAPMPSPSTSASGITATSTPFTSLPTASPRLGFGNQVDNQVMGSNETVAAAVAAVLLLATVTVVAIAGMSVGVFFCCRRRERSDSRNTASSGIHLVASVRSGTDAVYSEVMYGQVDDSRPPPTPYELPATTKKVSDYEFDDGKDGLVLLEEEQFIRTTTGATIASRTTMNRPKLDRKSDTGYYTGWVVPTMDQRREIETRTQSSPNIYWELEPYYHHCSGALEGTPADTKVPSFTNEPRYEFDIYWQPGLEEGEIYSQMSRLKYREIPRHLVTVSNQLGEGQFGEVYQAEWEIPERGLVDVAVKLVKKGAPREERVKLLQEATILGQFKHNHVVSLLGVVTLGEPMMMVMELLHGGNLHKHLLSIRGNDIQRISASLPATLLNFCRQVAEGLSYLAGKSFVHRDIAARNILLDEKHNCKIADFGMSRDLDENNYYVTRGGQIPIKWTAPEAILYQKYSTSSDVWSYGMLMYEIWSLGHRPFGDKMPNEVVALFDHSAHYCQPPPPGCPRAMYAIMVDCWNPDRGARPSASGIAEELSGSQLKLLAISFTQELSGPMLELALSEDIPPILPACTLGAPLEEGRALYQDLQTKYN